MAPQALNNTDEWSISLDSKLTLDTKMNKESKESKESMEINIVSKAKTQ